MPLLATIRNLGHIGSIGLLDSAKPDNCVQVVRSRLEDADHLKHAK